ncbi:MAG TPA: Gfo/Idh/MocA family oxidoreductase [Candidatus Methanoperedens sp.]
MRYIIVGYGNIGKKRHRVLDGRCVAIVDPFLKDMQYGSCKEVPLDIYDAAIVAVPNNAKIEILEYLLMHGKHALIEKPLLFNSEQDAYKLDSLAQAKGAIWYTSYNHRFEPLVIKLKEFLEKDAIGRPYFASFIYGNGTVQNIIGTWRDAGYGVLEDLGCHLLDLSTYLFPGHRREYKIIGADSFEAKTVDYCSFSTVDGNLQFLCSTLMWKNTFRIEVFGNKGSLHLDGLHKWGENRLIYRERVFPSGVPAEKILVSSGEDKSWESDIAHFEEMTSLGKSSYENDFYISSSINALISDIRSR